MKHSQQLFSNYKEQVRSYNNNHCKLTSNYSKQNPRMIASSFYMQNNKTNKNIFNSIDYEYLNQDANIDFLSSCGLQLTQSRFVRINLEPTNLQKISESNINQISKSNFHLNNQSQKLHSLCHLTAKDLLIKAIDDSTQQQQYIFALMRDSQLDSPSSRNTSEQYQDVEEIELQYAEEDHSLTYLNERFDQRNQIEREQTKRQLQDIFGEQQNSNSILYIQPIQPQIQIIHSSQFILCPPSLPLPTYSPQFSKNNQSIERALTTIRQEQSNLESSDINQNSKYSIQRKQWDGIEKKVRNGNEQSQITEISQYIMSEGSTRICQQNFEFVGKQSSSNIQQPQKQFFDSNLLLSFRQFDHYLSRIDKKMIQLLQHKKAFQQDYIKNLKHLNVAINQNNYKVNQILQFKGHASKNNKVIQEDPIQFDSKYLVPQEFQLYFQELRVKDKAQKKADSYLRSENVDEGQQNSLFSSLLPSSHKILADDHLNTFPQIALVMSDLQQLRQASNLLLSTSNHLINMTNIEQIQDEANQQKEKEQGLNGQYKDDNADVTSCLFHSVSPFFSQFSSKGMKYDEIKNKDNIKYCDKENYKRKTESSLKDHKFSHQQTVRPILNCNLDYPFSNITQYSSKNIPFKTSYSYSSYYKSYKGYIHQQYSPAFGMVGKQISGQNPVFDQKSQGKQLKNNFFEEFCPISNKKM